VAIDYNAGFVGALAKMADMYGGKILEDWPKPEDFRAPEDNLVEYFCRGWIMYEGFGTLNLLMQVNNRSAWPPTMKDKLSVRYFMDLSEVFEAGGSLDDVEITLGQSEGAKLEGLKHYADNIYYFTVDFTGTKIMPAEWNLCEKDANVSIRYKNGIGSHENDWSYQNLSDSPDFDAISFAGLTPYIPVYDNGVLLWGEEPPHEGNTPNPTPSPTPTGSEFIYGDVNSDNSVDSLDVSILKRYILRKNPPSVNLDAADLNGDDSVDSLDLSILKRYVLRKIPSIPI